MRIKTYAGAGLLVCFAAGLWGHGGVLLMTKRAGPYLVSLFAAEAPLRAGAMDLSIMVQGEADQTPVIDANVAVVLRREGEPDRRAMAETGASANKLLYAAAVTLPSAGEWLVEIQVKRGGTVAACETKITVLPAQAPLQAYWPYFAVVPAGIALFAMNQVLKARRQKGRPRPGSMRSTPR